ncbi:F-box protein At5g07610-like [Bidens hawaiensis]|uniref:F-box protein At5g07610-like n=1 Tax=Bidens hawaiensis TaxID=980011 RepID=UPI00404B4AD2
MVVVNIVFLIPPPSNWHSYHHSPKNICSMALVFHPTHCVHYKVVCIRVLKAAEGLCQIQVYSSNTRSWKICVESFSAHYLNFRDPAVHWAPSYLDNNFLYYKLDGEQLQTLPVPEELVSNIEISMYFGESRGHLHLIPHYIQNIRKEDILHLNVYEMLRDHSGWFFKYRLQLDALLGDFPEMIFQHLDRNYFGNSIPLYLCGFKVVDVVRGKEEEETFLMLETALKMVRYNVHDKSFKELYNYEEYSIDFEGVHRYIEALSSF